MIALLANWKRILYGTALALLGTLLLVQTARIEGALFWKGLKAENTELRETLASMKKAQKLARKAQLDLNKAIFNKQTEIARLTDENETNKRKVAGAASTYADRMRFDKICQPRPDTPAESGIAESSDRPSADAVLLSRADFDILNGNTARLMDVKAWGDRMIAEGLAQNP